MNPAKRKKLYRISLAEQKAEVKEQSETPVPVPAAPAVEVPAQPVAELTLPREEVQVEAPKNTTQFQKKSKKTVETGE